METKVKPTVETWLCRGYLFLMLALLPLAVHNGFFDITETKTICFTVPTVVFVLVRLGFTLYRENGLPRACGRGMGGAGALSYMLYCVRRGRGFCRIVPRRARAVSGSRHDVALCRVVLRLFRRAGALR